MGQVLVGVSENGRRVGDYCKQAKLTDRDVQKICELHESGIGYRRLAKRFNVSRSLVRYIIKGERRAAWVARFRRVTDDTKK